MHKLEKKTTIIAGVSGAGKSSYIRQILKCDNHNVIFANQIDDTTRLSDFEGKTVHFNLRNIEKNNSANQIEKLSSISQFEIVFIVAGDDEVFKRNLLRDEVEPIFGATEKYESKYITSHLCGQSQELLISKFLSLFTKTDNVTYLDSSNNQFIHLPVENLKKVVSRRAEYSSLDIEKIKDKFHFEYQSMQLNSEKTQGQNRKVSEDALFFDISFKGKSVLDVGCAYGHFSFAAKERGASHVLGIDKMEHRFIGANILKSVNNIDGVDFKYGKLDDTIIENSFDVVLVLNVIHHLDEPFAFLKKVASLCKETLIMEYPDISDNKFNRTVELNEELKVILRELPFIGVSEFDTQDQFYLFNDEALKRIMITNSNLFTKVEFMESGMSPERRVAIFRK